MNYVGIDISINSTGMAIQRKNEIIFFNFTTLKRNVGWIKKTMDIIDYEFINYTYKDIENYTENELMKLREFDLVTTIIYNKIIGNIDKNDNTIVAIEGYNMGLKNTNSIIDIISFSTLLRIKLLELPGLEKLIIISPKTLKLETSKIVYGVTISKNGKEIINKNNEGKAGGHFDKRDMMKALLDMDNNDKLTLFLKEHKDEILKLKNIVKPFDDITDAKFILFTLMK